VFTTSARAQSKNPSRLDLSKPRGVTGREEVPLASLAQAFTALRPDDAQTKLFVELNRCLDVALNNMGRGLSMFDAETRLIVCNKLYREIYSLPEALTRPGTPLAALLRFYVKNETGRDDPKELESQRKWITTHVADLALGKSFSHTQFLKNGRIVLVSNQPLAGGGWVDIQEDITERRQAEEKIDWLARHDTLTEIANRHQFNEQLEKWCAALQDGHAFALHWIDLDHFKGVNDTFGHPAGDALLKSVTKRFRNVLRESDIVGRLGGDEFAILQAGAANQSQAKKLVERVQRALAERHRVVSHQVTMGASIGIALAPKDGCDPEVLMKKADLALYSAKNSGRGTYAFCP
jgi:diguanylate cyclase (GGDEF)-like protein